MIIVVNDVPITGKDYEADLSGKTLEIEEIIGQVHFQGSAYRANRDVRIKGIISAKLQVECHRCLDLFCLVIRSEFELFYRPAPFQKYKQEMELSLEELGVLYYEENTIDLIPAIRDTINLEIPMKLLCKEDCKGLCHQCGINLNHEKCSCNQFSQESDNPFKKLLERYGKK